MNSQSIFGSSTSATDNFLLLEKSWNGNPRLLRDIAQPRRHAQMDTDIKKFGVRSVKGDPSILAQRREVVQLIKDQSSSTFQHISTALNFRHHEGSDTATELKVVKVVLIRESQMMTLHHLHDQFSKLDIVDDKSCLRILEALAQIRDSTLNYLEALCLWRQSIRAGQAVSTRPFMWEGKNYTLRIVTDLDFLADNNIIIKALKISPHQFRSNPLMLTNNLHETNTWMEPTQRAAEDTGGLQDGPLYENRLKLRYAERILLQEIEINSLGSAGPLTGPSFRPGGAF